MTVIVRRSSEKDDGGVIELGGDLREITTAPPPKSFGEKLPKTKQSFSYGTADAASRIQLNSPELGCTLLKFRFLTEGLSFRNSSDFGEGSGTRLSGMSRRRRSWLKCKCVLHCSESAHDVKLGRWQSRCGPCGEFCDATVGSVLVMKLEDAEMRLKCPCKWP